MIGKYSYEITHDDFAKGISTNDDMKDAGISSLSTGIDLFTKPGLVLPVNPSVTVMSGVGGLKFIASCDVLGTPYMRYFLGDDRTLYGFKTDGTVATIGPSGGAETYSAFNTDMIQFNAGVYASHTVDITKYTISGGWVTNWFSTTAGGAALGASNPHPLLNFNKQLYVADGNLMRKYDADANASSLVFTHSTETQIIALGVDPSSGRMLVSFNVNNANGGLTNSTSYVGYYDGTNPSQFLKKVQVDSSVTAFYSLGGVVYVIYDQGIGIWNGNGITFLRRLTSSQAYTSTPSKQKITNMGHVLLVLDGTNLLAYGETIPGQKVFSNLATLTNGSPAIAIVGPSQSTGIGYTFIFGDNTLGALAKITINQTLAGAGILYTNDTHFPRPKFIRGMDVFLEGVPSGSSAIVFTCIDDNNTTRDCSATNTMTTAIGLMKKRFMFEVKTTSLQIIASMTACTKGIKRIIVYYDDAE